MPYLAKADGKAINPFCFPKKKTTMADAKQGKSPMEDFYNGSSPARVVLAKPRLGGFGSSPSVASSSSKSCNPFGSVLRPPQLKPGSNPFLKVTETEEVKENESKKENEVEDRLKETNEDSEAPKFVPLGSANVTARTSNPVPAPAQPPATSSSGFVFGQNLSERVIVQENINNGETPSVDHSSSNGTTELLFTNAAASVKENVQEEAGPSESQSGSGSLAAAAAEYERSHARPPPPATSHNITGEEGEINVLQISCRLFAWEAGSWRERGRGVLRLNDAMGGARLVARVAGSLRVVLNTKLWPDMVLERAGTKSLRITACDAQQQVKLFLIMGSSGDISQLHRALTARVAMSKPTSSCGQSAPSQQAAERLDAEFRDKPSAETGETGDETTSHTDEEITPQDTTEKTEDKESPTQSETKLLKRKEPADDETSPKRQCPDIVIQ